MNAFTNEPQIPQTADAQPLHDGAIPANNTHTAVTREAPVSGPAASIRPSAKPSWKILELLGAQSYDPRWEHLQRDFQITSAATYIIQGSWASIFVFALGTFYAGLGEKTALIYWAFALNALSFACGFACIPGLRTCIVKYSDPRSATSAIALIMLGIGLSWSLFSYITIVYLPDEWHGLAMATTIGVMALGGLGTSAYPALSLAFMSLVVAGGMLGIVVSERPIAPFYFFAWLLIGALLHVQFFERSRDALNHVRDRAELQESEAEKRKAIQSRHEAERQLITAQEEERLRDEQRRIRKNEARKTELLDLATQFEATIGEVSETVASAARQSNLTARAMSQKASEALAQIEHIAEAMEQVARGSTAAAAASDEFAISIDNVSGQAETAARLARFTNEMATATDATVAHLTDRAEGIGDIANLINSIAGRTRLLAINASIEAARGGETGRGFAVVASQVKELASQTSTATGDVSNNIEDMQRRTRASAKELAEIREQIDALEASATNIAAAMNQQSQASRSLAESIDLAATGAADVSATTQGLRSTANTVGEVSSELMTASNHLNQQAELLKRKVADFLDQIRRDQD